MAGIGLQSAGTTSAGFGSPATAAEQGGAILRNTLTGESMGGRKIDPRTGDYVMDEYGRLEGMPNVRQMVMLAVLNAAPALADIDRLTDGFAKRAEAILANEMTAIVSRGLIRVIGVRDLQMGVRGGLKQGQALYKFLWVDLTTNTENAETI
jgi:hypothetical protein